LIPLGYSPRPWEEDKVFVSVGFLGGEEPNINNLAPHKNLATYKNA
jgi:hypothetical protein